MNPQAWIDAAVAVGAIAALWSLGQYMANALVRFAS